MTFKLRAYREVWNLVSRWSTMIIDFWKLPGITCRELGPRGPACATDGTPCAKFTNLRRVARCRVCGQVRAEMQFGSRLPARMPDYGIKVLINTLSKIASFDVRVINSVVYSNFPGTTPVISLYDCFNSFIGLICQL